MFAFFYTNLDAKPIDANLNSERFFAARGEAFVDVDEDNETQAPLRQPGTGTNVGNDGTGRMGSNADVNANSAGVDGSQARDQAFNSAERNSDHSNNNNNIVNN